MLLFKVGKYEHLKSFICGNVHFTPLSYFRADGTLYRGDELEGKLVVDTSKGVYINGVDISKMGAEVRITQTYLNSDNTLIFCASRIDSNNAQKDGDEYNVSVEFIKEMRKFGEYAVVFELDTFANSLFERLKNEGCRSSCSKVAYCDKNNSNDVSEQIAKKREILKSSSLYYIKDIAYEKQNEWRFVIEFPTEFPMESINKDGSLDIQIKPFPVSEIMNIDELLNKRTNEVTSNDKL